LLLVFSSELLREKDALLYEKAKLKDIIKKCESDFIHAHGKQSAKDDRSSYKEEFEKYKVRTNKKAK
jgi:hypothetical protein